MVAGMAADGPIEDEQLLRQDLVRASLPEAERRESREVSAPAWAGQEVAVK
jgi:hypothetical protein